MDHQGQQDEAIVALLRTAQADGEEAYSALFERYAPLIESVCGQYLHEAPSEQELRSAVMESFLQAIRSYNVENQTVTFGLYARICINNRIVDCLRKWKRIPKPLSLDSAEYISLGADESSNPAHSVVAREQYLELRRRMVEALSKKECRIWELFIEGRTTAEIAELLGMERKSVENAIFRARKKLRQSLPKHP